MAASLLDQLIGLTPEEVDLLKTLSRSGAATAEEVALKLNRPGDDLTPQMTQLVERKLVKSHLTSIGSETFQIYQVDPAVRKALGR